MIIIPSDVMEIRICLEGFQGSAHRFGVIEAGNVEESIAGIHQWEIQTPNNNAGTRGADLALMFAKRIFDGSQHRPFLDFIAERSADAKNTAHGSSHPATRASDERFGQRFRRAACR